MFIWTGGDQVTFVGIHFARFLLYDHSFFSPVSGIERDLGSLEFRAAEFIPEPPFDVTIEGPNSIDSNGTYEWSVAANEPVSTYQWWRRTNHQTLTCTYQTDWVTVGTGATYESYESRFGYDFELRVSATSVDGDVDTFLKLVSPTFDPICPE